MSKWKRIYNGKHWLSMTAIPKYIAESLLITEQRLYLGNAFAEMDYFTVGRPEHVTWSTNPAACHRLSIFSALTTGNTLTRIIIHKIDVI